MYDTGIKYTTNGDAITDPDDDLRADLNCFRVVMHNVYENDWDIDYQAFTYENCESYVRENYPEGYSEGYITIDRPVITSIAWRPH